MLSLTKNEQGDRQVGGAQSNIGVDRDIKIKRVHLIQKENAWRSVMRGDAVSETRQVRPRGE